MTALRIPGFLESFTAMARRALRLASGARFEAALLGLLLLTAVAIVGKDQLLERTVRLTPASTASNSYLVFSDGDTGGGTTTQARGPLSWNCELRGGSPYPYCGYELFIDREKGSHGLDLSNMRSFAITMMYQGQSTSFRVHMKNFDPRYSVRADDETPKYLRVEADTTPGRMQRTEFVLSDFGVADWWLRKHKLPPQFGRPQFDNVTSLIIETGSEAPLGRHAFFVQDIVIRTAILSDAQWYSLLLGIWIVMIVLYLGYRVGNLSRALAAKRTLEAIALREAQEAARRDHLTGLLNRRGLTERFDELSGARRNPFALTVILIDIDHFKALNDTHGHAYGDQVLAEFARVIGGDVRAGDLTARWGGEEFIIVCADIDRRGAMRIAEKLRERIANHDFGACGPLTASFGIHWSHGASPDLVQLVAQADIALYAAKAGGRNCCRLHSTGMSKAA